MSFIYQKVDSIWALHIIIFASILFISLQPNKAQALHDDSIKALNLYNSQGNCMKALPLLKKAEAEHGDILVQFHLGQAYGSVYKRFDKSFKCILVEVKNDFKSFWYFSRAATNSTVSDGDFGYLLMAQNNLALAYATGDSVIQDITKAYMWVSICLKISEAKSLSATAEAIHCKKSRDFYKKKYELEPTFISESDRLADVCISSNFKKCGLPE